MGRYFSAGGRPVVAAQAQPAMRQEQQRQGAGNQQAVIEPIVEESDMAMRLDEPAIERVQRAGNQEKRIENVTESIHKRARIIKPKPKPSNNFNKKTFVKITPRKIDHRAAKSSLGKTSLVYDWANDVLSESYSGGILNGLTVTNQFDAYLRRTNVALLNGSSVLCRAIYGYDNASRLATVSDGTNAATYSYLANSPLAGQIMFTNNGVLRMTTSKQYDYVNRLSSISSTPSNSFAYQYNAANQRTMDSLCDGSYWRYAYDALGQVISGNKYWVNQTQVAGQQFDYTFDTIGNRTQTESGGDQNGGYLRVANYTNNTLNQITSRSVPGDVDVMGLGIATNAVTVNGQMAYRNAEYFRQQLAVTNTANAVWQSVTVTNNGASVSGHAFVAQTPENYTYDADGNLLSDGRWTYAWDGENRLVGMTSLTNAPSGSQMQLLFSYDYQGRRIQKMVSTNNGTSYIGEYTNNYTYDGWNCIALLNSASLLNSFMWGSDLSGSMQGAGGVGGLVVENIVSNGVQFAVYDGNGNVSALVNATNGSTVATYEYGPFGEVIRQSGPMAKLNPFRFSTKYNDDETDFLYYGYRYYNSSTGRWLSKDPLIEKGFRILNHIRTKPRNFDINPYIIVGNNPETRCDALGLCCKCMEAARAFLNGTSSGATFSPGFYTAGTNNIARLGEKIYYVWIVQDNPRDCKYQISEIGGLYLDGPTGPINGLNGSSAWNDMIGPTYGNYTASFIDYMGWAWPPSVPPPTGTYDFEIDLVATLRCTGADGVSVTKEFPEIVGAYTITYP